MRSVTRVFVTVCPPFQLLSHFTVFNEICVEDYPNVVSLNFLLSVKTRWRTYEGGATLAPLTYRTRSDLSQSVFDR